MSGEKALLTPANFASWLMVGERGVSSEAMVAHLTGNLPRDRHGNHPYDPSDFRRCERLLRHVPIARLVLTQMRSLSPVWDGFIDHWDELVALMESECPGVFENRNPSGQAPKTYALMQEIRSAVSA